MQQCPEWLEYLSPRPENRCPAEILPAFMTRALARTHQPKASRSPNQVKQPVASVVIDKQTDRVKVEHYPEAILNAAADWPKEELPQY